MYNFCIIFIKLITRFYLSLIYFSTKMKVYKLILGLRACQIIYTTHVAADCSIPY